MYILDTDTITHLHAGHPKVVESLQKLDDPDVGITIITKIELLRGRFDFLLKAANGRELNRAQQLLDRTEELLSQIVVLPIDERSGIQFETLQRIKKLRKIGRADILIAGITLAYRATLVTRNLRHFRKIHGLIVTNWVD